MEPIRVLHIVTSMNMGGIENYIMNNYRNIDRTHVQFDFLKHRDTHDFFDDEILSLGGRIYSVPPINPLKQKGYNNALKEFFKKHKGTYSIVHSHINTFSAYPLRIAKEEGIRVRIAHAHATTKKLDLKTPFRLYTKGIIVKQITEAFACSEAAGRWLFGKFPYKTLPNAIDAKRFIFDEDVRLQMREELKIENNFVIGMVANFSPIKNHEFIIKVFENVCKRIPNSKLLFVGDGSTRRKIEQQVETLGLKDKVIFAGVRKDINKLLQAVDVFVLPSFSEGFPVSALEAQTSGVPCILSTGVPKDVKILSDMETDFVSLDDFDTWVEKIVSYKNHTKKNMSAKVLQTIYDVGYSAAWLQTFYENKYNEFKNRKVT